LIADYVVGRLNPQMLEAFEKHLGQCPDCAAFLNTYKKTIDVTQSFLKLQSPDVGTKRIKLQPKKRGSLALLGLWVHLFGFSVCLTT
jgi:anti-sigma factor RsiW